MELSTLSERIAAYFPALLAALPVALIIVLGALALNLLIGRAMIILAHRTHLTDLDVLPVRKLLRWLIRIVAVILILGVFGFQIGGIWAMLSTILGLVAIGFVAVWSLISHTTATMLILLLRPFHVGDDIEFAGEPVRGRVIDINFFYTTVIDHEGMLQQIPNNLFFQKTLKRRINAGPISLAVQLHADLPAKVALPPPPVEKKVDEKTPEPDPNMMLPDPRSIAPPSKSEK